MNLRATSFSLLSILVGNTQTKLTLRQYSLQCYLHCRLIYSIVLNVFISSVCQNQTRPCRQFYNMPRLPTFFANEFVFYNTYCIRQFYNMSWLMFRLNIPAGGVDVRGVEPLSKQIISYTLYILVNILMISQNIRFKPLQSRSKALSAASWLITPLISYNASERIKTWLKIYRNPHDTKILRGLYSAFLIHFAGFD